MFIIPIMIYISWLLNNAVWAYIALGLATTGAVLKAAKEQQTKQAQASALQESVANLLKGIKATQN